MNTKSTLRKFPKNGNNNSSSNNSQTKKNKKLKQKLVWNQFDEIKEEENPKLKIECIYSAGEYKSRETCDTCGWNVGVSDEGYHVCSNPQCGILYHDSLDESAEWRYYGANDSQGSDPTRCGMPTNHLLKESSFGCKILCNGKSSYEMRKIRRYTEWQSMPYHEKSLYEDFERIKIMGNNAGIPKMIIDEALRQHKKISQQGTFRALNRDGIIAASLYISFRIHNFPRASHEIATIFYLDNASATKGCRNASMILNKMESGGHERTIMCQTKPIDFIERYCSKLQMNTEMTKLCKFLTLVIEKKNLMPENTPHSVACGVVFFISQLCKLNITKRDVKHISEVSEVTINKCFKKLESIKSQLLPTKILEKYA